MFFFEGSKSRRGAATNKSQTHGHTDESTRHDTGLLEINTPTELGGSAVTSWRTLSNSHATTMAPPFSPYSAGNFLRSNLLLPMDANLWGLSVLLSFKCWSFCKKAAHTIFKVFGMTLPGVWTAVRHRFEADTPTITPPSLVTVMFFFQSKPIILPIMVNCLLHCPLPSVSLTPFLPQLIRIFFPPNHLLLSTWNIWWDT